MQDGYIENYTSLALCDYSRDQVVFFNSVVNFDEKALPEKLDRHLFASDCTMSADLAQSFIARERANESNLETIRDNLYKILKVGFRGNHFSWKSRAVYKNVTVVGKYSLETYLSLLIEQEVLRSEASHTGLEDGFVVAESWQGDARKLIEEKNFTQRMAGLAAAIA